MKEGGKKFVNNTGSDVNITLFIREGGNPKDEGPTQTETVPHNGEKEVIYNGNPGPEGYVFLNGLLIEWRSGSDLVGVSRKVVERGDAWDSVLNTNDTVTITSLAAGTLDASGSNTNWFP